jgi:dTDP-4-dehydrorhamnose reductase
MEHRLPRTAVIGAGGYLGRHFLAAHRAVNPDALGVDLANPSPHGVDLAAPDIGPLNLRQAGYEYAVVAAAVTGLARCESDKAYTRTRNVTGTLELARQLAAEGVTPVFFSSDNVFDGQTGRYDDEAPTNPINEYGAQKAEVERRLPEVCAGRCLILRLGKVFGLSRGDRTLLDEMADRLMRGQQVPAARDMIFSPILLGDLLRAVLALQTKQATGLFNLCGPEAWSRFDIAQAVARTFGSPRSLVKAISLDDLKEPFRRPKRADMGCRRLQATVDVPFQPLSACIAPLVEQYREAS